MYEMPRLVLWEKETVPLPLCMYRVPNLHGPKPGAGAGAGLASDGREKATAALPDILAQVVRLLQRPSNQLEMLESRQLRLLEQLESLQKQMQAMRANFLSGNSTSPKSTTEKKHKKIQENLPNDIVINVSPDRPPFSLIFLQQRLNIEIDCHTHSSVPSLTPAVRELNDRLTNLIVFNSNFKITLIWKNVGAYSELVVASVPFLICGEINILKYLMSAMNCPLSYCDNDSFWQIDSLLDICHKLQTTKNTKERRVAIQTLSSKLGKEKWINGGSSMSIVDIAAWSIIKQLNAQNELTGHMKAWMQNCENHFS